MGVKSIIVLHIQHTVEYKSRSIIKDSDCAAYATQEEKLVQKSDETEDLRVRRTRKMLQEALIGLTVEKGFAAVTVQDIAERAMVNRSTIYRHYPGGKYDLLAQYQQEVNGITSAYLTEKLGATPGGTPTGLINLLKHVQQFGEFYRVMLGQNGDPVFTERFRKNAMERFRFLLTTTEEKPDPNAPPIELKLNYISCAAVGAIIWWLDSGQPCTVEQLAIWLSQLNLASAGLVFRPVALD
jgi:AcrR family transcriptional regulator